MKTLLVATLLLLGSTSFAGFSGIWRGTGELTRKDGSKFSCEEIVLNISQSQDKVEFGKFYYACNSIAISFHPPIFGIENNRDVVYQNKNIGSFDDKNAKILFPVSENAYNRYTVQKTSDITMNYSDEQIDVDTNGNEQIVSIKATLRKSND